VNRKLFHSKTYKTWTHPTEWY